MGKVIKFVQEQEKQHSCPNCDLVFLYFDEVVESETPEELFEVLSRIVSDAKDLGLKEYLVAELGAKAELLDILEYGDECCDCDECEDFCDCEDED